MQFIVLLLSLIVSHTAVAQNMSVPGYDDAVVGDISLQGLKKNDLFRKMQERIIKFDASICANRAHMWSFDFKRFYQADSAKIFIFYTPKTSRASGERWWYHVAPVINEGGAFYAMDRAFMQGPATVERWLEFFAGRGRRCYEIKNEDRDLIERMFITMPFPAVTPHGEYDCYYKIAPATIWFPIGIAMDLLQVNGKGEPILFTRNQEIPESEVLSACLEAASRDRDSVVGWSERSARKRCEKYLKATEPGAAQLPITF
jgi:hypothetical protein